MFLGRSRILFWGGVILFVLVRVSMNEILGSMGYQLSTPYQICCTGLLIIVIFGSVFSLYVLGSKAKKKKEFIEGAKGPCPTCNSRLVYMDGSGWYCQNCMAYRK